MTELIEKIHSLPPEAQQEIAQFIEYLCFKYQHPQPAAKQLQLTEDPLAFQQRIRAEWS
jgi:hypothetical protein